MTTSVKPITGRQKEALDFVNSFIKDKGFAPSLKELAKFLQTDNLSTARYFLQQLEQKGHLKRDHYKSRGITTVSKTKVIPLLGFIAAGKPIEPIENSQPIEVPQEMNLDDSYSYYALKVVGDSMIDMGILENDVVLIKHQLTAQNGDVIVALTEDGATLKVYREQNGRIVLEPRNKNYDVIIPKQLEVRGKFVGLIRTE